MTRFLFCFVDMNFPRGRGDQKTKHGISGGWGEYGETLWNGKSWGVGGSNWKNPPWGGYGYFLEPHNPWPFISLT